MATKTSPGKALFYLVWFKGCIDIEKVHPLEGGFLRLKFSRDRRPGLPLESPGCSIRNSWSRPFGSSCDGGCSICGNGSAFTKLHVTRDASNIWISR